MQKRRGGGRDMRGAKVVWVGGPDEAEEEEEVAFRVGDTESTQRRGLICSVVLNLARRMVLLPSNDPG